MLSAQAIATLRGTTLEAAEADLREAGIAPVDRTIPWTDPADLPDVSVDLAALDAALNAPDNEDQDADAG